MGKCGKEFAPHSRALDSEMPMESRSSTGGVRNRSRGADFYRVAKAPSRMVQIT